MAKSFDLDTSPGHLLRRAGQYANDLYAREQDSKVLTPRQFAVLYAIGQPPGRSDPMFSEVDDIVAGIGRLVAGLRSAIGAPPGRPYVDVAHLQAERPALAGFSFGSFVAAKAVRHVPAKQLITIAPPVGKYPFDALPYPNCPWLIVQGEDDDVVSAPAVFDWVAGMPEPPTLVRMPDTGHFFHRRLMDLRGAIKNAVKHNLPPAVT